MIVILVNLNKFNKTRKGFFFAFLLTTDYFEKEKLFLIIHLAHFKLGETD